MYARRKHQTGYAETLRMRRKNGLKRHFMQNVRNNTASEIGLSGSRREALFKRGLLLKTLERMWDMEGFVPLDRGIMESAIWEKPPYYLKIYLYMLMKAAYRDGSGLERGQFYTTKKELCEICESGKGGSKQTVSQPALKKVLHFLESEFPESPVRVQSCGNGRLLITLLNYSKITCVKPPQEPLRVRSGSVEENSSIIYNNNNKYNNLNNNKTSGFAPRTKKSKFNNFSGRDNDYEAKRILHRERVKALAERIDKK